MNHNIDTSSVISSIMTLLFVGLGELAGTVGSLTLQEYSYIASITIVVETLVGSPVKKTMGGIWKKWLNGDK